MAANDIYFEDKYTKNKLLQVSNAFSIKKTYVGDTMAAEMGHTVLRLPHYNFIFNSIEQM